MDAADLGPGGLGERGKRQLHAVDGARIVFVGRPDDGKPIGTKSDVYALNDRFRRNRLPHALRWMSASVAT